MSWASLSLKNLTNASREVDDWEDLGIQLDIKYHELQKFVSEHQKTEERKRAMLQFWLDHDTQASWEKVISALSEMKLNRVAEEIKRKYQLPPTTRSEDVPPVVPTVATEPDNVPTADSPSIHPTDQPEQTVTAQSENVNPVDLGSPSAPPTEQPEETSTKGVRKVKLEIAALETMYDELVGKAGVFFSKRQALSSDFFVEFRLSVAVLPTSLKYQHSYFLKHHSSEIAKATTVEEIFSILNNYWNFLNCSLLAHIISKFGDEELKRQLNRFKTALQSFRSQTKINDFVKTCPGNPIISPEFAALKTKLSPEWKERTLEDVEVYRMSMVHSSSLASYALYLVEGVPGSIYLLWSIPNHAIDFLADDMNTEFLQHHCIEEVTINGVDLEEYKHQRSYIFAFPGSHFELISQHVDELSEGLVWASRESCLEDVVFLLSTGVEVNSRGQWEGRTALMWASEGGCLDIVKELLRVQAGVDMQDEDGWTALMLASVSGHTDVVQLLLSSGAQVDLQDNFGRTALIKASESGHTAVVQLLLSSGGQVDLQDRGGRTALIKASESGHTDVVQLLLSSGAQVDLQDKFGRTALMLPSFRGHADVVQLLLSSGAQVDLQSENGSTALMLASGRGHTAVVQLLLSSGAQMDLHPEYNSTALMLASDYGHIDVVQLLLSRGAQVNLQNELGETALMWASESGHPSVVQLLLSGGAQVDLQDVAGLTALIHAVKPQLFSVRHDKTGTVKALLAARADVNHQEETSGRSAVFYAAEEGDLEMVKLLIQGGANLNLKDKDGVTADQVAEVKGHHAVCEELRKHMHGDHTPLSKTVRDRVLATGQLLRALYKRLEEKIIRTQKKELGSRTQGLDPEMILPSTPSGKGVRDPKELRQQEKNIPGHVH